MYTLYIWYLNAHTVWYSSPNQINTVMYTIQSHGHMYMYMYLTLIKIHGLLEDGHSTQFSDIVLIITQEGSLMDISLQVFDPLKMGVCILKICTCMYIYTHTHTHTHTTSSAQLYSKRLPNKDTQKKAKDETPRLGEPVKTSFTHTSHTSNSCRRIHVCTYKCVKHHQKG